jgi:hypothetical protein
LPHQEYLTAFAGADAPASETLTAYPVAPIDAALVHASNNAAAENLTERPPPPTTSVNAAAFSTR